MNSPYRTNVLTKAPRLIFGWIAWCYLEYRRWRRRKRENKPEIKSAADEMFDYIKEEAIKGHLLKIREANKEELKNQTITNARHTETSYYDERGRMIGKWRGKFQTGYRDK